MSVNADKLVQIVPRLISGGTTGLSFAGLLLSKAPLLPVGSVLRFDSAQAVGRYLGQQSDEYVFALSYFAGPVNAFTTPKTLYMARHAESAIPAWLAGDSFTGTLESLQAIVSGGMDISIDGKVACLKGLNFSTATTLSHVASVIADAISETDAAGPAGVDVTYNSIARAFVITSGTSDANSSISWARSPSTDGNTDLSTVLRLTEQAGAVISHGINACTLSESMNNALSITRDWVSFSTLWEPKLEEKLELARWQAGHDTRFCYVPWDTDVTALKSEGQSFGRMLRDLEIPGVAPQYNSAMLAANFMGFAASLDFNVRNGRATAAYRQFENQPTTVNHDEDYENALANGYNVYADFATAGTSYRFYQPGQVSGQWEWADTYLNAIALKDSLQLNILDLLKGVRSLPYNE